MDADRWQKVNDLFHAALGRAAHERHAFLADVCAGDDALIEEVERLVRAHADASRFMSTSAVHAAADLLAADDQGVGGQCGPYRIVGELGRGGMGAVYLAERADAQYQKRVALKLIKRGMDTDAMLARFRDERQILAFLDHPNIARLLDGGTTADGRPYFVMELVEGQPIDGYCDDRRLSVEVRLGLFLRACAAVSYAHQHLVVHRDIKPSNILVAADDTPKLLDFGIAKILHEDGGGETMATVADLRRLTPEYASPEQVQGLRVTTATDVYSLGVVLYELLSGRAPYRFANFTQDEVLREILETRPHTPSDAAVMPGGEDGQAREPGERAAARGEASPERLRRRLRGDLDTIVLKALRKEPERRYLSVEHLAEDIRRHLDGRPVLARSDTFAYRAAKFVRRHKGAAAAALLVCLTLVGGIIATAWQARRASAQERIAKAEQARAQRRFDEVRKLARSVLFDYHDAIKDLPGATPVRARLVRDALEYLDSLAKEASDDRSLQLELASAYERVGDVQGGTTVANLGDTAGAIQSYRKALVLREATLPSDTGDRDTRRQLALTHRKLGTLLWETGEVSSALATVRNALSLFQSLSSEDPRDRETRFELGYAMDYVGWIQQEQGDIRGALEHHRKGREIAESLPVTGPDGPKIRRFLSVAHEHEGTALLAAGQLAEALQAIRRARDLRAALSAEFPLNAEYRRTVGVSYYNEAEILAKMGRTREALDSYRKNLAMGEEGLAADPKSEQARGDVAYGLIRVGDMLAVVGDNRQALSHYRRSRDLRAGDVKADPPNLWKRSSLIEAHAKISKTLAKAGQTNAALAACAETLALMEATNVEPTNAIIRSFFADTYADLGEAHTTLASLGNPSPSAGRERWHAARDMYRRSLDIWHDLRDRSILNGTDRPKVDTVAREIARCDRMLRA